MSAEPPTTPELAPSTGSPPAQGPKPVAAGCVLAVVLAVGLGALGIHLALRPSGDPVGDVDLLDGASTVVVDGEAGDSLTFVGTIATGLGAYGGSSKNKANAAVEAMKASTLKVLVTAPDGREETASCPLWGGSMSTDRDDHESVENGVINDCSMRLGVDGRHTVAASVDWADSLTIRRARITVYRDRP